ncbi:hypothetical protein FE782_29055 [Paenibacillus antri]|uniref:Flavodoxin-like domain-containing protein n=1 Tax=Paenibacillus antri TaxID=2582848 RepID=A0A5R9GBA9_9BACL|nr:flavodoxin domain-containing protein [Paenibacillus antri]TLS48695.1 hypothetical protein FE782_29055 [Paenibacillus antri]
MRKAIVYATRYGFTAEVAAALRDRLGRDTELFDLAVAGDVDPEPYDVVVLGSSVYMGRVQRAMRNYVERYRTRLAAKRYGLYICAANPDPLVREQELRAAYFPLSCEGAAATAVLGHAVRFERLGLVDRFVARAVLPEGSVREPSEEELDRFAERLLSGTPS